MKWVSLVLPVGTVSVQHCRKSDIDKSSGFCTIPDPALHRVKWTHPLRVYRTLTAPRGVTNSEEMQSSALTDTPPLLHFVQGYWFFPKLRYGFVPRKSVSLHWLHLIRKGMRLA
jgi:hypothetical protein